MSGPGDAAAAPPGDLVPAPDDLPVLDVRPRAMRRVAFALEVFFVVLFAVIAVVEPAHPAGASFTTSDQVATGLIGPLLALGTSFLARPRMRVDLEGVHLRGFVASWKTVPWDLIRAVRFPASVRFAQLQLPGEETLAVMALQRFDGERAIADMQRLRAWFAATHADGTHPRP